MGILLKAENQEKQLRKYEQNINLTKQILQTPWIYIFVDMIKINRYN